VGSVVAAHTLGQSGWLQPKSLHRDFRQRKETVLAILIVAVSSPRLALDLADTCASVRELGYLGGPLADRDLVWDLVPLLRPPL
jgi:hypothetical protein